MRVLIGCESSGVAREAFRSLGHDAWSCDLLPAMDKSLFHLQCDVVEAAHSGQWDIGIFHPPCTYLSASGMHWTKRGLRDPQLTEDALKLVRVLMALPFDWGIENPIGCISTRIRKPDQIIQPHQFGDDASKRTCLWLKGLPLLRGTRDVPPRKVNGKPRWANQTDSGQNLLGPSVDRWRMRSQTYPGIAAAMANQWGRF